MTHARLGPLGVRGVTGDVGGSCSVRGSGVVWYKGQKHYWSFRASGNRWRIEAGTDPGNERWEYSASWGSAPEAGNMPHDVARRICREQLASFAYTGLFCDMPDNYLCEKTETAP